MLMQMQARGPSAAQELAVHGWEPSVVAIHPHERWAKCELGGPHARIRRTAEGLNPVQLSFSECPMDCSKLNLLGQISVGPQILVCHFSLELVMGYNTTWLSGREPARAAVQPHEVPTVRTGHTKTRPEKHRELFLSILRFL